MLRTCVKSAAWAVVWSLVQVFGKPSTPSPAAASVYVNPSTAHWLVAEEVYDIDAIYRLIYRLEYHPSQTCKGWYSSNKPV